MKFFKSFLLLALPAAVFFSCGGNSSDSADKESISRKKQNELLTAKKSQISSLVENLRSIQSGLSQVEETDSFAFETDSLDFTPVYGTHSDSGEVNKNFNAIYISSVALGGKLPEFMPEDYFTNEYFSVLSDLAATGTVSHAGLDSSDSRYWNTAIAWMTAVDQLRYVIIVEPLSYTPGNVSAVTNSMDIANLQGRMYVYDLKKKTFTGAREFTMDGPDEISFSYQKASAANGWNEDPQKAAEYQFKEKTKEYILGHTIGLLSEYVALPATFTFKKAE